MFASIVRSRAYQARRGGAKFTSLEQPAEEHPLRRVPVDRGDRVDQRYLLRIHLDAVLGLAAPLDAALAHHRVEPLARVELAGRMQVEEPHLADGGGADEIAQRSDLRARLEAASARHAARQRIGVLLVLLRLPRPRAELVRAVEVDPGLDALEVVEHARAVDEI